MKPNRPALFLAAYIIAVITALSVIAQLTTVPAPDLYRYSTIRVAKGTVIETVDGKYIALKDENWIHEEQYLNMQKEKARVTEMLVQAQRRR